MSSQEIFLSQFEILSNYNLFISKKRQISKLKSSYKETLESLQESLKIAEKDRFELGYFEDCGEFYQERYKEAKENLSNFESDYIQNLRNLVSQKIKHEKLYKFFLHKHKEKFSEESYNFIVSMIENQRKHNIEQANKRMKEVKETSHKNECLYKLITILFSKRLHNHVYLPCFNSKEYRSLKPLKEEFDKKDYYPSKDTVLSLIDKYSIHNAVILYTEKVLTLLNLKSGKKSDNYITVIQDCVDIAFK